MRSGGAVAADRDINWPYHQWIDLGAVYQLGYTSGTWALAVDNLSHYNRVIRGTVQNNFMTFLFLLGPRYSRHEVIYTHNGGPDFGIPIAYMAKVEIDIDPIYGYHNPVELLQSLADTDGVLNWVSLGGVSHYHVAVTRNLIDAWTFRVGGAEGAPFTAGANDSDGYFAINGGPGCYAIQIRVNTKDAPATGYKQEYSAIGVHRITEDGYV